jgi:flagellar basal body P-ring formation protein FlgA
VAGIEEPVNLKRFRIVSLLWVAILSIPVSSALAQESAFQSPASLQSVVQSYLEQQTAGQPGDVKIKVNDPDPRLKLVACARPEAFLPNGAHLAGRILVGVRCTSGKQWQVFVPAEIRVSASVWVASRALLAGVQVAFSDLRLETVDITTFSSAVVMQPEQAVGKTLARSIAAGLPVRLDALKDDDTLTAGETVRVDCVGTGFKVSAEGKAVSGANANQSVQVRMPSGKILTGIVRPGKVVELRI